MKLKTLSGYQKGLLRRKFELNPNPSLDERWHLSEELGVERDVISAWFSNRRSRVKVKAEKLQQRKCDIHNYCLLDM